MHRINQEKPLRPKQTFVLRPLTLRAQCRTEHHYLRE